MYPQDRFTLSLEFYPPRSSEGKQLLWSSINDLEVLDPEYVSVTFGAGGSTKEPTFKAVENIISDFELNTVPHLSCLGSTEEEISEILNRYQNLGISEIMALRGDIPEQVDDKESFVNSGDFRYGSDLVEFLSTHFPNIKTHVAAYPEYHPEANDPRSDLNNFATKVRAGADTAVTQYFFNNLAYYKFIEDLQSMAINIPVNVGLMPITDYNKIKRFSQICGAEIPMWIRKRMESYKGDPRSQKEFGIEVATIQAEELIDSGVPGIHFYTLNKAEPTLRIARNLGLYEKETTAVN